MLALVLILFGFLLVVQVFVVGALYGLVQHQSRLLATIGKLQAQQPQAMEGSRVTRTGLSRGAPAPDFTLATAAGRQVSRRDFLGSPLLILFTDPSCGPCHAVLTRIQKYKGELARAEVRLLVVSRGAPSPDLAWLDDVGDVVYQPGWRVSKLYALFATPSCYLIDADAVVAAEPAVGGDDVFALVAEALARFGARSSNKRSGSRWAIPQLH